MTKIRLTSKEKKSLKAFFHDLNVSGSINFRRSAYFPFHNLLNKEFGVSFLKHIKDSIRINNPSIFEFREHLNDKGAPWPMDLTNRAYDTFDFLRGEGRPLKPEEVLFTKESNNIYLFMHSKLNNISFTSYNRWFGGQYELKLIPEDKPVIQQYNNTFNGLSNWTPSLNGFVFQKEALMALYNDPQIKEFEETMRQAMFDFKHLMNDRTNLKNSIPDDKKYLFVHVKDYYYSFCFYSLKDHSIPRNLKLFDSGLIFKFLSDESIDRLNANEEELMQFLNEYNAMGFSDPNNFIYKHDASSDLYNFDFIDGKIHPFALLMMLSSSELIESFEETKKKRKFSDGDTVYVRSSVTGTSFEVLSGKRISVDAIKPLTVKNLLPAIVLNSDRYLKIDHDRYRRFNADMKAYDIQLFEPDCTIRIKESMINSLDKKRYFKEKEAVPPATDQEPNNVSAEAIEIDDFEF